MDDVKNSAGRMTRRAFLGGAAAAAGGSILLPAVLSHAQDRIEPGKPIPPILFESFSESMTMEAARLYTRELARIGIRLTHRPMAFPAFLGKVYFEKNFTLGMGGFGAAVERIDPDFWIRSLFHSKGGFNISGYANPDYDKLAEAQEREVDPAKRKQLIVEAQRMHARDLPSWWVIGRPMVNPVNNRLFANFKPRKNTGFETYSVFPYLELQPKGHVKEVHVGTTYRMSSAHLFTERSSNGRGYLRFVYDTFLAYDNNNALVPWAAESYKVVDPTTVDLKIRDGMKWHDGKPVTAQDAKFTIDYLLRWKPPLWSFAYANIKSAELVGTSTLRVRLNAPSATFITVALTYMAVLPQHIWKDVPEKAGVKHPDEWDMARHGAIGSGPFKFAAFQKDVDCHVVANREHWTGGPKVDGIHYVQAASVEQLMGSMENESLHIVGDGLNPPDGQKLAEKPYIQLFVQPSPTIVTFFVDNRKALFKDPAFRRAMYLACPKQRILDVALASGGLVARRSPLPPVFTDWIPSDLPGDEFNLDAAKKVLADAGYSWSGSGELIMKKA